MFEDDKSFEITKTDFPYQRLRRFQNPTIAIQNVLLLIPLHPFWMLSLVIRCLTNLEILGSFLIHLK